MGSNRYNVPIGLSQLIAACVCKHSKKTIIKKHKQNI